MIGRKVMRTLASVEVEIILILGLPCCLSSSSVRCLENVGYFGAGPDNGSEPFDVTYWKTETPESPPLLGMRVLTIVDGGSCCKGTRGLAVGTRAPGMGVEVVFRLMRVMGQPSSAPFRSWVWSVGGRRGLALEEDQAIITLHHVVRPRGRYCYIVCSCLSTTCIRMLKTPPSLRVVFSLLSIYPAPFVVPSSISSPMILLIVPSLVASPATDGIGGFLTELESSMVCPRVCGQSDRCTEEYFVRHASVIHRRIWELSYRLKRRDVHDKINVHGDVQDLLYQSYGIAKYVFNAIWSLTTTLTHSRHTVAPPTSLPESTSPTLFPILRRIARMAVRVPPAMSPDLSATMAECHQGTSELVENDEEGDDKEEDEEMEESSDSDSVSEDAQDEGPTTEDGDPAIGDEGLAAGDKGPGMVVKSHGSDYRSHGLDENGHSVESNRLGLGEEEEVVLEGQQQAVMVIGAAVSTPLGLGYGALRHRELALDEDQPTLTMWTNPEDSIVYIGVPAYPQLAPPAQTPPSLEWSSVSLPISPAPSVVPSPISSPMIPLILPSPVASPATAGIRGFLTKLGAQLAEERRARLELAEIVDSMRRGREPRGDV
ncbi:hypothetical protein Tco_0032042 [Tanacetum coccineum]